MLSRYVLSALLLAGFAASSALASPIVPVDVFNPTFRQVKYFADQTGGPGSVLIGAPYSPPNVPSDVDDFAAHGLGHPGGLDPVGLRSALNLWNGSTPGFRPGSIAGNFATPGLGQDYYTGPPAGSIFTGGNGGMLEIPFPTYAFGGTAPGPDALDGILFNFLVPGPAIEFGLNFDNNPAGDTDPNTPGCQGCEGLDGLIALPGTFINAVYTLDLTTTDAYGGFEVIKGQLTGSIYNTGLGGGAYFDPNGVPIPSADPNVLVLPFQFLNKGSGVGGSSAIGLDSTAASGPSGGLGSNIGAEVRLWCDSVATFGACQFQEAHGYMTDILPVVGDPNASTRAITELGLLIGAGGTPAGAYPGGGAFSTGGFYNAWGLTTSSGGGGIPLAPGARAVPIGVIHATGAVNLAGTLELMSTNGDLGFAEIPEPGTLVLLGAGLAGLAALRRRRA